MERFIGCSDEKRSLDSLSANSESKTSGLDSIIGNEDFTSSDQSLGVDGSLGIQDLKSYSRNDSQLANATAESIAGGANDSKRSKGFTSAIAGSLSAIATNENSAKEGKQEDLESFDTFHKQNDTDGKANIATLGDKLNASSHVNEYLPHLTSTHWIEKVNRIRSGVNELCEGLRTLGPETEKKLPTLETLQEVIGQLKGDLEPLAEIQTLSDEWKYQVKAGYTALQNWCVNSTPHGSG